MTEQKAPSDYQLEIGKLKKKIKNQRKHLRWFNKQYDRNTIISQRDFYKTAYWNLRKPSPDPAYSQINKFVDIFFLLLLGAALGIGLVKFL